MSNILRYLVFVVVFLLSVTSAFAQDPPPPVNSELQRWFCLKPVNYTESDHITSLVVKDGVVIDTTKPTYVIVKIAFDIGDVSPNEDTSAMTTGTSSLDTHVFNGTQGLIDLQNKLGFSGGVSQGTNPTNTFPVVWEDELSKTKGEEERRSHFWYGMQESDPTGTAANGNLGSQQQGTFAFDKIDGANDCAFLSWDPWGYVFDSVTYGPIKGVYVRLLTSKTENGVYMPVPVGIGSGKVSQNPVVTNSDGSYKFYVDPGYYKLELLGDIKKTSNKYIIERNIQNIRPGYDQFGYQQIYIAEKPEVIHEVAGKVERRDIAIQSIGAPAPFSSDGPKLKEFIVNRSIQKGVPKVRISGRSLFIPIDLIAIYKDTNNIVLEEKKFSLVKGHKYIPQNSADERNFDIWMDAQTKDKKGLLTEVKATSKFSTKFFSFHIDPMPSYLDGIANDKTGKPIIDGFVRVYPIGSNKPTYKTTTDEDGHFTVNSDQLPPLPYSLVYTSITGDEIKISTAEYLKQNATYHKANLIDSYSIQVTESDPNTSQISKKTDRPTDQTQPTGAQTKSIVSSGMQGVVIVVIVLMMLVMIGVGAFVVMKYKQQPPQI